MDKGEKLLSEIEAQQAAEKFLLAKYFDSKVDLSDNQLITRDTVQIYQLRGEIIMRSRGLLDRFVSDKAMNRYYFQIDIDAREGHILNYEFT